MSMFIKDISKSFSGLNLYRDFNVKFRDSQITGILGPSGCGKTTLLNMITGNVRPDSGEILGFKDKRVSAVFQEPRLLPWKTVTGNIDFVLKDLFSREERNQIIARLLKMVSLDGFANYYPKELSSGMKQRVAIARALAYPSEILLLDEPFRALDLKLKVSLIRSLRALWNTDQKTVIFVTHDVDEVLLLCDMIYVFEGPPVSIINKIEVTLKEEERLAGNRQSDCIKRQILSGEVVII